MTTIIYHEKQVGALCAVHALNNLFQQADAFSKESLDAICKTLDPNSWINSHKSVWGVGDFDFNVVDAAVQSKGYRTQWLDQRMDPTSLILNNIFGFIVNVPSKKNIISSWVSFTSRRHWYAIRNLPSPDEVRQGISHYHNLNSFLDYPQSIGQEVHMVNYIRTCIADQNNHIILVVTPEVAESENWKIKA